MADQRLKAYRKDTRGNITIISALCMLSMTLCLALAIDSAGQLNTRKLMQAALDSASLTGAKVVARGGHSDDEVKTLVINAFHSNMLTGRGDLTCGTPTVDLDADTGDVSVDAECTYPTMLGGSLTPKTLSIEETSTARGARKYIDVAMVLDVSGSMRGTKIEALKTAAKNGAKMLLDAGQPGDIRVSTVSYSTTVNAGQYGRYAVGEDVDLSGTFGWWEQGCVTERVGDGAWDDRAPAEGAWVTEGYYCPSIPMLPLTASLTDFENNIDYLYAGGGTAGHIGIAWSWYLISPKWEDIWPEDSTPLAYNAHDSAKAIILMTDGEFNRAYHAPYGNSHEQAVKLCEEIRDTGILIFSVAFQAPTEGQETLKSCAGVESRYYEASSDTELINAYEDIAALLTELRLVE